jgi:hypothetical protein
VQPGRYIVEASNDVSPVEANTAPVSSPVTTPSWVDVAGSGCVFFCFFCVWLVWLFCVDEGPVV